MGGCLTSTTLLPAILASRSHSVQGSGMRSSRGARTSGVGSEEQDMRGWGQHSSAWQHGVCRGRGGGVWYDDECTRDSGCTAPHSTHTCTPPHPTSPLPAHPAASTTLPDCPTHSTSAWSVCVADLCGVAAADAATAGTASDVATALCSPSHRAHAHKPHAALRCPSTATLSPSPSIPRHTSVCHERRCRLFGGHLRLHQPAASSSCCAVQQRFVLQLDVR